MSLFRKISRNFQRQSAQQLLYTAEASTRRSRRNMEQDFEDAVEKTIAEIRARRTVEAERDCALDLVRRLAVRSEAYRRAVEYLGHHWQPADPQQPAVSEERVRAWADSLTQDVGADTGWVEGNEAELRAALAEARSRIK